MPRKRLILKDVDLTEISSVDRPAQPTAKATIIKSHSLLDKVTKALVVDVLVKGELPASFGSLLKARTVGDALIPAIDKLDNEINIIQLNQKVDKRKAVGDALDNFAAILQDDINKTENDPLTTFALDLISGELTKSDEDLKMSEELSNRIKELEKQLSDAVVISKLNDEEKEWLRSLPDDKATAFKAMSSSDRQEQMRLAKAADEKLVIDGTTIAKSAVGADMFAVIKAQQAALTEQKEAVEKAQAEAKLTALKKRAADEFGSLPGTDDAIAELLKSIESLPEAVRSTAESIMKAAATGNNGAFIRAGVTFTKGADGKTATEELAQLAKSYAKDNNVSYEAAYTTVIEKRADLYEASLSETL